MSKKIDPGEGWRLLVDGEQYQQGDEWICCGIWFELSEPCFAHEFCAQTDYPARRRITADDPATNYDVHESQTVQHKPAAEPAPLTGDTDFDAMLCKCIATLASKGADYAGKGPDRLANFARTSARVGVTEGQALLVFLSKHQQAVENFIRGGGKPLESEPIEDRIMDVIVYHLLLYKMVREERVGVQR